MHALPLSVQHPSESSQPRLRGPLADGEGPAEWIASLKAARAANWPERKVVDKDPLLDEDGKPRILLRPPPCSSEDENGRGEGGWDSED